MRAFCVIESFGETENVSKLTVTYRADSSLSAEEDQRLRRLLFTSFPHVPAFLKRRWLRACPAHRWLVLDVDGQFVAHVAVHEKIIGTVAGDLKVGGIAEVCVASRYRRRGLTKQMLTEAHEWMREHGFSFAMLFGQPTVYASSGYAQVKNEIAADNSLLRHWNPFCGKPMIKSLSVTPWPSGRIDLRGPTF